VRVTANDEPVELPEPATVADLLTTLGLDKRWVVVERNGEPVARPDVGTTALCEGDRIELVRAVAGG
jgi:thiamine biosynthesis protein ThiS